MSDLDLGPLQLKFCIFWLIFPFPMYLSFYTLLQWVQPFPIPHVSKILWYFVFGTWLISPTTNSSGFIYVCSDDRISLFKIIWSIPRYFCVSHVFFIFIQWWTLWLLLYPGYCHTWIKKKKIYLFMWNMWLQTKKKT